MEKQCKYTETYDPTTESLHIVNEYGCDWENGVGYAPDNSFCGECNLICAKTCAQRTLIHQHLVVYIVMKICDLEYGCREIDRVFSTYDKANEYVKSVQKDIVFWTGKTYKLYTIEEWKAE